RATKVTEHRADAVVPVATIYAGAGHPFSSVDEFGSVTIYGWDFADRLVGMGEQAERGFGEPIDLVTLFLYDRDGLTTGIIDPSGPRTHRALHRHGSVVYVNYPTVTGTPL